MNKTFKLLFTAFAVLSIVVVSGCGAAPNKVEPPKEPKEMLSQAFDASKDIKTGSSMLTLKGDLTGPEDFSGERQTIKFDFALDMTQAGMDDDSAFSIAAKGSADFQNQNMNFDGEIRMIKDVLYGRVDTLSIPGQNLPKEVQDELFGKWWSYALPAEMAAELKKSVGAGNDLSPEQKRIIELMKKSDFLSPEYVGNEKVEGTDSFKYSVTMDPDGLVDFLREVGKATGSPLGDSQAEAIKQGLGDTVKITGFVFVAQGDMPYVSKMQISVVADDPKGQIDGSIDFTMVTKDVNKDVSVSSPDGAEPFSPLMLGGLGLIGTPAPMDSEDFDPSQFDDADLEELNKQLDDLEMELQ